ncbi:pectinesterase inhibitor-like [Actinidia eriantha]|uniref:pectinesterase inhibitor-like n=1 Tax=Actinidia eriantha TaxID=165200 RepID=UPI0025830D97|nr:pectinesterase inhibitor-like [Actinidia eriantha]
MAYCSTLFVSLLLMVFFISLSFARPEIKATADLISQVCSKTLNPSLCSDTLKSDPRSATADLKGLGQISIDKAQSNAKQASGTIASLSKQTTDPKVKNLINGCGTDYQDAVDELNEATQSLKFGDIFSLRQRALAALSYPVGCDNSFKKPPVTEPLVLKQANTKLEGLCSVVVAVADKLIGGSN